MVLEQKGLPSGASLRHTEPRHGQGAQGTDKDQLQAGIRQTAKDDGGNPCGRFLARGEFRVAGTENLF
jgi:hypothetical protein